MALWSPAAISWTNRSTTHSRHTSNVDNDTRYYAFVRSLHTTLRHFLLPPCLTYHKHMFPFRRVYKTMAKVVLTSIMNVLRYTVAFVRLHVCVCRVTRNHRVMQHSCEQFNMKNLLSDGITRTLNGFLYHSKSVTQAQPSQPITRCLSTVKYCFMLWLQMTDYNFSHFKYSPTYSEGVCVCVQTAHCYSRFQFPFTLVTCVYQFSLHILS